MSSAASSTVRPHWTSILTITTIVLCGLVRLWSASTGDEASGTRPIVLSPNARISEQRCLECHADIVSDYALAPHSRTLTRATAEQNTERFNGRVFRHPQTGTELRYRCEANGLKISTEGYARDVYAEWIFGSGTHACTPLITWTDGVGRTASVEHAVSWYPDGQLGTTLGMEALDAPTGISCLGAQRTPAETINCFGCHSTHVPVTDGAMNSADVEPGIGCIRCHWNASRHLEEMDEGLSSTIEKFSELTAAESVDRCGECHRRAEELGGEIRADDETLARFAPVGLTQSLCFIKQRSVVNESGVPMRLDCATCHNPHRPSSHEWQDHTSVCLNCHDTASHKAADCTVSSRDSNCLPCHMPAVPANRQMSFTDHWIRIRAPAADSSAESGFP